MSPTTLPHEKHRTGMICGIPISKGSESEQKDACHGGRGAKEKIWMCQQRRSKSGRQARMQSRVQYLADSSIPNTRTTSEGCPELVAHVPDKHYPPPSRVVYFQLSPSEHHKTAFCRKCAGENADNGAWLGQVSPSTKKGHFRCDHGWKHRKRSSGGLYDSGG